MIRDYFETLAFWFLLFFAIYLMIQGFRPMAKIVGAQLPIPAGAKETLAV